jgi:hypothetical protein
MDIQRLKLAIFEKTGIRVDDVDPVFVLVALNQAILEEHANSLTDSLSKNNAELDERIGSLVVLHRSIQAASENLVERSNQAHMSSALKAAAEAKAEIMTAAKNAIGHETKKTAELLRDATQQLEVASEKYKSQVKQRWVIAMIQAVISGIVAGVTVLVSMHYWQ